MKIIILFLLLAASLTLQAQTWTSAFTPGYYDINGKYIGGTEVMALTPHKGKLYAATSYVCDLGNATYDLSGGTPILVLDSANGEWKQEILFTDNLLIPSLKEIIFTKDYLGNEVQPDTLLVTGPNNKHHHIFIYVKDDATGNWIQDSVTTVASNVEIRSISTHYDAVTGHQFIFLGVSDFGIWKGEYDPSIPGKIQWDPNPEWASPTDTRFPAICDVNGEMYFGITDQISWVSKIYRRVDGLVPTYNQVFADSSAEGLDIRGFTSVKDPSGAGNDLWFYCNDYFRRLLPQNNDSIVTEMQVSADLTLETGRVFSGIIIAGYNDHQLRWKDPSTNDTVMVIGMQAMYDSTWLASNPYPNLKGRTTDGMYFTRKQDGADITYKLHYIVNNTPIVIDTLLAVRTFCISPFAEDSDKVLYSGGYHTNGVYLNNTAWAYRGDFTDVATTINAEPNKAFSIPIYPNPAQQSFTIYFPAQNSDLVICDVAGRKVYEGKNFSGEVKINCRNFPSGVYFAHITTGKQSVYNQKIIVAH